MNATGNFIWYELMTGDATAAAKFYGAVVGWKIADDPAPSAGDLDYRMIGRSDVRSLRARVMFDIGHPPGPVSPSVIDQRSRQLILRKGTRRPSVRQRQAHSNGPISNRASHKGDQTNCKVQIATVRPHRPGRSIPPINAPRPP